MSEPCPNCDGTRWVCENHPDKAWEEPDGCDCGAGMPCPVCNGDPDNVVLHDGSVMRSIKYAELGYATRLLVSLMEKHFPDRHPEWAPLPDLMGVLTQLDNISTGLSRTAAVRGEAAPVGGDLCIDCDGEGVYPSGARCKSCEGTGRVAIGDGVDVRLAINPSPPAPAPVGVTEAMADRLRKIIEAFDEDVAAELATEGERADLWGDVDVPIDLLREIEASLLQSSSKSIAPSAPVGVTEEMVTVAIAEHSRWSEGSESRAGRDAEWHVLREDPADTYTCKSVHKNRAERDELLERMAMRAALEAALAPSARAK